MDCSAMHPLANRPVPHSPALDFGQHYRLAQRVNNPPLGAFLSSSLPFQYRFICASDTFAARCSSALFWTTSTSFFACCSIADSAVVGSSSPCAPIFSDSAGDGSSSCVSVCFFRGWGLSSFLDEAGMDGLVTLAERELKERVCWARGVGLEALRRVGGMAVVVRGIGEG